MQGRVRLCSRSFPRCQLWSLTAINNSMAVYSSARQLETALERAVETALETAPETPLETALETTLETALETAL